MLETNGIRVDLIDISSANHPDRFRWRALRERGLRGAYVRGGGGATYDSRCAEHCRRLRDAGIPYGIYWYDMPTRAIAGASAQGDRLAEVHHRERAELAPAHDIEQSGGLSPPELAAWLRAAMLRTDASLTAPQRCIVYHGVHQWQTSLGAHAVAFADRLSWLSQYGVRQPTPPYPYDEYGIWQHSANTIWIDRGDPERRHRFGPVPRGVDAQIIARPGVLPDLVGEEVDCNVLGHVSLDDLRMGRAPRSPLDPASTRDIQRAMRRLGIDCGPLDGLWGPRSRAGLVLAQRRLGLEPTGALTDSVRRALVAAVSPS